MPIYIGEWWKKEHPEHNHRVFEDFKAFLALTWRHLSLPPPTPVQYDIADYLQNGPTRSVIEAFRGVGKSWITSAFVVWLLLRDPQLKIMVVSASKERADQFSTFTLRLIHEMPILRHLIPQPHQRQSKISFDVGPSRADHSPSVKSVGIMGQLTGSRADLIIADDVEVPNNSDTQGMRDKLSERVKEFSAILKPLASARIIYLGTPQCEDSLYNQLPERGYEIRIWPARYPAVKSLEEVYGDWLAPGLREVLEKDPKRALRPTDPRRFGEEDLFKREADYGRSGFALQFMLDTRLSDADRYPLKLRDLLIMGCNSEVAPQRMIWSADPKYVVQDIDCVGLSGDRYYRPADLQGEWIPYTGSVMAIDPSGRGSDETAYAVVKFLNGYLFVTSAGGLQGGYDEQTLTTLAKIAKKEEVKAVIVESNFGDGMFTKLLDPYLRRFHPCLVEEVRSNRQKELRIIDTLEPVMNQHRLVIDRGVIENDMASTKKYPPEKAVRMQLMYQMSRITREKGALAHDDRLDALAIAVAYWVEQMGHDEKANMASRRAELMAAELESFSGHRVMTIDRLSMGMPYEVARQSSQGRPSSGASRRSADKNWLSQ